MRRIRFILLFFMLCAKILTGQICPEGMTYFNNGEYAKAAEELTSYSLEHANQSGICLYFAGEAYYNLGLEQSDVGKFKLSIESFNSAVLRPDLQKQHFSLITKIKYKIGWASFRLYELGSQQAKNLQQAITQFEVVAANTTVNELNAAALYMVGECQFRLGAYQHAKMMTKQHSSDVYNRALNLYNNSIETFISDIGEQNGEFKLYSLMRSYDVQVQKSRLLLLNDRKKEAVNILKNSKLDQLKGNLESVNQTINSHIKLAEMSQYIYMAYLADQTEARDTYLQSFNDVLAKFQTENSVFGNEIDFLQAASDKLSLFDHVKSKDFQFIRYHLASQCHFEKCYPDIQEAKYWLAIDHLISRYPSDRFTTVTNEMLRQFVDIEANTFANPSINNLKDDAAYLILKHQFEKTSKKSDFQNLLNQLKSFDPVSSDLLDKKELLVFLVKMRLSPGRRSIWVLIGNENSVEQKCEKCFNFIDEIFRFATQTVGRDRAGYLKAIDYLFGFTEETMPVKTRFYLGMKYFLEAEIQNTRNEKKTYFIKAVNKLTSLSGEFADEGNYILARSYFEAARNAANDTEMRNFYSKASKIFARLIVEKGSLRALYYLAEIKYIDNDVFAVKEYCNKIIDVLKDKDFFKDSSAKFFYDNALARVRGLRSQTDAVHTSIVNLSAVTYPDVLLRGKKGNQISLEKFVSSSFTQEELYQESLNYFLRYSYSRKGAYCSVNRLAKSISDQYCYNTISAPISECLENIKVDFKIRVNLPPGLSNSGTRVYFNKELITPDEEGLYQATGAGINDKITVKIMHELCYYSESNFILDTPGVLLQTITLNKKYRPNTKAELVHDYSSDKSIFFTSRFDKNIIMHNEGRFSQLKNEKFKILGITTDFLNNIDYRDFIYSKNLNQYLAVRHAYKSGVLVYDSNGNHPQQTKNLRITYQNTQDSLSSAEGITEDSKGNIYIVDYSNHRVVKFNPNSEAPAVIIGGFGRNSLKSDQNKVKFQYPKRIAIIENIQDSSAEHTGNQIQALLFVSDRNGIHQFDDNGYYHGTIIPENIDPQDITGLSADFILNKINLYFADRRTGDIYRVQLSPK